MGALGKDDSKDGMGTAAGLVHVGGSHSSGVERKVTGSCPSPWQLCLPSFLLPGKAASPRLIATVHEVGDVCIGSHSQFRQVLHIGAQYGVLPDPQRSPALGIQEVSYSLTIDLHIAHLSERINRK